MLFVITCLDGADSAPLREAHHAAHESYLRTHPHVETLLTGPLLDDDGETVKGTFFLVEAENRQAVEAWQNEDPLNLAEVWQDVVIEAFDRPQGEDTQQPKPTDLGSGQPLLTAANFGSSHPLAGLSAARRVR